MTFEICYIHHSIPGELIQSEATSSTSSGQSQGPRELTVSSPAKATSSTSSGQSQGPSELTVSSPATVRLLKAVTRQTPASSAERLLSLKEMVPAVIEAMRNGPFTIMIDESNDKNTEKRLVILARLFDGKMSKTRFLDMPIPASGKATDLFAEIDSFMR
ncbi:connexin 27.5 [Plakobranchus ocellatus]|uniref:Connexin 27.5 n=1 Tax=Plakobranchus ocellatus TaxID=259542 RepID=A0AAV3ZBF5_9GAST|nr:connexin 27.5 [Plakobranchus ocellatus]